jgi:hypothetical protein
MHLQRKVVIEPTAPDHGHWSPATIIQRRRARTGEYPCQAVLSYCTLYIHLYIIIKEGYACR